jgi:hypothetical protein
MSVPLYISRTKHIQNEMEIRAEPHWPGGAHMPKKINLSKFRGQKRPKEGICKHFFNKIERIESGVECSKIFVRP